jgi:prolyl 4-hydroxylase
LLLLPCRYEKSQFYRPHHDFFADEFNKRRGGQRICTVLMYLSTPEEGGETVFPHAGGPDSKCTCGGKESKGMSVQPKKGRAVIFWSQTPEGKEDPKSLHGGCDVVSGVKWSATKWIRSGKFV